MISLQSIKAYLLDKKLQVIKKKNDKKELEKYLISCRNPTEAIDKLSAFDLERLSIEVYSRKIDGYYNLYDYILRTKNTSILAKEEDLNNPNIYLPWIEYSKGFNFLTLTDEILLDILPSGKRVIDFAIETGKIRNSEIQYIQINKLELAKILYEKKFFNCLAFCDFALYNQQLAEGKTIFDVLMENKIIPNILGLYNYTSSASINNCLLKDINGKTILEHLIDYNFKFKLELFDAFFKPEELEKIKDILLKKNRFDLVKSASSKFLGMKIKHNNQEESVIHHYITSFYGNFYVINDYDIDVEFIEECLKAWNDIRNKDEINKGLRISDENYNYDLSAEGEFQSFVLAIPRETFKAKTSKGVSVLELVLQYCNDKIPKKKSQYVHLVFEAVNKKYKVCPQEFSLIFIQYGLITKNDYVKEIGLKQDEISDYIYPKENIEINDEEIKSLINEFYNIYDDGKSFKKVLDLVIYSFKKSYQINSDMAIRDLKVFIEMKKKYPEFCFIYDENKGSCFSRPSLFDKETYISLNNLNDIYVLNHECGHLLHFFCQSSDMPEEARKFLNSDSKIKDDQLKMNSIFEKIISLSEELLKKNNDYYDKEFANFVALKKGNLNSYIREIKEEFNQFFGTDKILLENINDIINTGIYTDEVLEGLIAAYCNRNTANSKEELIDLYVKNRIEIEKKYFKDMLFEKDNSKFLIYENFVDAYYEGKLGSYLKHKEIKVPAWCHDTIYFLKEDNKTFQEMLADYISLSKMDGGQEYIERLKEDTSPEFIDYLENYYKNMNYEQTIKRSI